MFSLSQRLCGLRTPQLRSAVERSVLLLLLLLV